MPILQPSGKRIIGFAASLIVLFVLLYQVVVPFNMQRNDQSRASALRQLSEGDSLSDPVLTDDQYVRRYWILGEGSNTRRFIVEVEVQGYRSLLRCLVQLSTTYRPERVIVLQSSEFPGYDAQFYVPDFTGRVLQVTNIDMMTGASYTAQSLLQATQFASQFMLQIIQ